MPEAEILLRNHDLVLLVGAAIQRSIEHHGTAPAGLAEAAPAYLLRMADQPSASPARPNLPNIAV